VANKNTGDLQWELRAICNVRPCADDRKAAGARTMGSNEKTMRRTMEAMKNTGVAPTSVVTPQGGRCRLKSKARPKP
jgi:hypothetical protein